MKIYTKTGDQGQTRLVDGSQVSKNHPRLHAYGDLDELNSLIGWTSACSKDQAQLAALNAEFHKIQNYLFNIGSHLACEKEETRSYLPPLKPENTQRLEQQIDLMNAELPILKEFILPGGSELAARLHLCRTVCRRSERHLVELIESQGPQPILNESLIYLNRLSDYFFIAARFANFKLGISEPKWVKE